MLTEMKVQQPNSESEKKILPRRPRAIILLFTLSFPLLLIAVAASMFPRELRVTVLESTIVLLLNIFGWLGIVRALGGTQQAIASGISEKILPWLEAFLGLSLKISALGWMLFRFASRGSAFAIPFVSTLVAYLALLLLFAALLFARTGLFGRPASALRRQGRVCMPEKNRVEAAGS